MSKIRSEAKRQLQKQNVHITVIELLSLTWPSQQTTLCILINSKYECLQMS